MTANELIESYVTEVAVRLPRRQRNDVAFELRALLHEELLARADVAGRAPDAALATDLLQAFGRPVDVAARYQPAVTIIDPSDGRSFLQAVAIGLAIIWGMGLWTQLRQPLDSGWDLLLALGGWWSGTVLPSLWWPGVLVFGFGTSGWMRRRWPKTSGWQPVAPDRLQGGRPAMAMAILGIACGIFVLSQPHIVLDLFYRGHAAPSAYEALTYTEPFLQRQAPWLFTLLALNLPLYAAVLVKGRWSDLTRRLDDALGLATCAAMAWTALDGPVMTAATADRVFKFFLALFVLSMLIQLALKHHRRVRPTPDAGVSP